MPGLFSNVDIAMYQAKELGRNRYVLFDQAADNLRSTHKRMHWAKRLRDALDDDRCDLFAQPVVRLRDQKAVHHEILVRVARRRRRIDPALELHRARRIARLVQEIDMQVVEKLLAFMTEHEQLGKKLRYFVNLSRVSISDQRWVQGLSVECSTRAASTQASSYSKITETAAMSEIDVTLNFIKRLKRLGCRFALDDFGAGFSSFYYLKRFEVDYLKIDGSFIRDLATDEGSRLFVRALNDVAQGLFEAGRRRDRVEAPEVLKLLVGMGAQYGPGLSLPQARTAHPDAGSSGGTHSSRWQRYRDIAWLGRRCRRTRAPPPVRTEEKHVSLRQPLLRLRYGHSPRTILSAHRRPVIALASVMRPWRAHSSASSMRNGNTSRNSS